MSIKESVYSSSDSSWSPISESFLEWLGNRENILEPGLIKEPTIKVLTFLALYETETACTYDDIKEIFKKKNVIKGIVPDNTLRTSVLNLGKALEKSGHPLELKSFRGRFQLIKRIYKEHPQAMHVKKRRTLLFEEPVIKSVEIARYFIEKSMLPFNALYFLESSARCWEVYSKQEAELRVQYEVGAWEHLGIKQRLFKRDSDDASPLSVLSLGPSEGLAEIALIKTILENNDQKKIHYLAVDSSPRLLRNHIGLLRETFENDIENGRLLASGVVADIFSGLREAVKKSREGFMHCKIIQSEYDFFPSSSSMLVTYFGNCLGNDGKNTQDPEAGFFSMIHSIFQNRPLEILVGVSVKRSQPDEYKRNWDDFLLQTPRHFLERRKFFESSRPNDSEELAEFMLSEDNHERCPPVIPEPYLARHQIEGQIYRFYYKLAFDLRLTECLNQELRQLPKGTLILLYSIIKYNLKILVTGIEKGGVFKTKYDPNYHQIVNTSNGEREYAVFSAYLE